MLQKILNKIRYKEFAVFYDEKGIQKEIKKLNPAKDHFKFNGGMYLKGRDRYNHFSLLKKFKLYIYYFYDSKHAEPLPITSENLFKNISGEPYIAEHLQIIYESKVLSDVNRKSNPLMDLDFKKVVIILGIVAAAIYFLSGGSLT